MTVSASSTHEFEIDQLVFRAYNLAGLMGPYQQLDEQRAAAARDLLELRLKSLEADGLSARTVDFYDLTLTAGEARYNMPSNVLQIVGNGMYIAADETDVENAVSEQLVIRESRQEWHERASKSATGNPSHYYEHRAGVLVQARFWPIPEEAGTVRFQVQRLFADATNGTDTLDLERPWQLCLAMYLAHDLALANNKSLDRVDRLEAKALRLLEKCKGFASPKNDSQAYLEHDYGYYNR